MRFKKWFNKKPESGYQRAPRDYMDELAALSVWQASRAATLEEAKQAAAETEIVEAAPSSYYAQLGDAAATREAIVEAIGKLARDGSSNE